MFDGILDPTVRKRPYFGAGFLMGILWLLILFAATAASAEFSFQPGRAQMIGVIMNSFFSLILVVLYGLLVVENSRQSEIQEQQKRMMEFDSGSHLSLQFDRWEGTKPVYKATNNGPGIILNICAETRLDSNQHRETAEPTLDAPGQNPGVLRAGETKEIILPFQVKHEGESISISEYHEILQNEGKESSPTGFFVFAENGSGEASGRRFINAVFGAGHDQPQNVLTRNTTVRIE